MQYVVVMKRVYPRASKQHHEYTLGVFNTKESAYFEARAEMLARAGKYDAVLFEYTNNDYLNINTMDEVDVTTFEEKWSYIGPIEYEYSPEIQKRVEEKYNITDWS